MEEKEHTLRPPKEEAGAAAEVVVPVGEEVPGNLATTTRRLMALLRRNFREIAVTARKQVTRRPTVTPRNVMKQVSRILPHQEHQSFKVSAVTAI